MVSLFTVPRLRCTRCAARVDDTIDRFCPECGAEPLQPATWFKSANCGACGKELSRGRHGTGLWHIAFCTHCGFDLADPPNLPLPSTSGGRVDVE